MTQVARKTQTDLLDKPVGVLRFATTTRIQALARKSIFTVRDLLENFPHRYLDMSKNAAIGSAHIGDTLTVVGRIGEVIVKKPRPRLTIVEVSLLDDTGVLFASWFQQPWIASKIKVGDLVMLSGKVEFNFGFMRMKSPFYEVINTAEQEQDMPIHGRIIPIHPLTEGISGAWMRRMIAEALEKTDAVLDPLPTSLRLQRGLIDKSAALRGIHFPQTMEEYEQARMRLAYEELLQLQIFLMMRRSNSLKGQTPIRHCCTGHALQQLTKLLPFSLTKEQNEAVSDILQDMAAPRIMNRMLLGDVGTGKTAVAAHALAAVVDSGTQACMMAPTTILAEQYGKKLGPLFDKAGISWALLTSATPAAERSLLLNSLADGSIHVLFGTHAVLQDDVVFDSLSLVIIDEQHRFGVDQRSALRRKGEGCDLLVMTATPIPRSLALTLYGDLDCSYIYMRPNEASSTKTIILSKHEKGVAYDAIRIACAQGRQAYIVCPLIGVKIREDEESNSSCIEEQIEDGVDVSDVSSAQKEARFLAGKVFPDLKVGLLTGQLSTQEKSNVMAQFRAGEIDVLVSTTVIEVGVDVPNATIMMIEDADRFGLSQLHQLRGRVGRGSYRGEFYLVASPQNDNARERLDALVTIQDGFKLAEFDLAQRKEGDILGIRQHGISGLRLVNVIRDYNLIKTAHADALALLAIDPNLKASQNGPLSFEISRAFAQTSKEAGGA